MFQHREGGPGQVRGGGVPQEGGYVDAQQLVVQHESQEDGVRQTAIEEVARLRVSDSVSDGVSRSPEYCDENKRRLNME